MSDDVGCAWTIDGATGEFLEAAFYDFLNGLKNGSISTVDADGYAVSYTALKGEMFPDLYAAGNFPVIARRLQGYYDRQTSNTGPVKRNIK